MTEDQLRHLLERVKSGDLDVANAVKSLAALPFEDLGYARIDHHREIRTSMGEVVFAPGKTNAQIVGIVGAMLARGTGSLVSRLDEDRVGEILAGLEPAIAEAKLPEPPHYERLGRTLTLRQRRFRDRGRGLVGVVCAGTSDLPVAHEAIATARYFDNRVELVTDVGVAGIHRLLSARQRLIGMEAIIAVAGMEGALPGVLAGLIDRPVIGVPTSVGYGTSFHGVSALLTMLNSCAPGVTVVNIDNGYGAAAAATLINRQREDHGAAP